MNHSSEKILKYLTGYENIKEAPTEDLQKQVKEHPYFAVTHFLLAQKLQEENNPGFLPQVQKTALYFPNPFWLRYQLAADQISPEPAIKEETISETVSVSLPNDFAEQSVETKPDVSGEVFNEEVPKTKPEPVHNQAFEVEEAIAAETRDTDPSSDAFLEQLAITEAVNIITNNSTNAAEVSGNTTDENNTPSLTSVSLEPEKPQNIEIDEHERMFQNIKAMLDATSEEADADTKDAVIPMDPYYTIDYFASQGIKLELDQNPQDQLGKQVKKFTQWLKHMKKLGPEDATEVISRTEAEADIQQIADTSNTVREVVTEAMATVLEKQGKNDKAIQLYNKLSFLNPHKSAYFADKIKNLKGS